MTELTIVPEELQCLTASFVPGANQPDVSSVTEAEEATATVAATLKALPGLANDVVFQINRCSIHANVDKDTLLTGDGEIRVVPARLYDWTGAVDVHICRGAIPALFGFDTEEDVKKEVQKVARWKYVQEGSMRAACFGWTEHQSVTVPTVKDRR